MPRSISGNILDIDVSQVTDLLDQMQKSLSKGKFETAMQRAFSNTGRKVKSIIRQEVPKDYVAKPAWVSRAVGTPRKSGTLGCVIPVKGTRGTLGGTFPARGGGKRRAKIQAQVVKGQMSTLPGHLPNQGGNPPFRNPGSKFGGAVMTRTTNKKYPVAGVVGRAVPQMVTDRSAPEIEKQTVAYLEKEMQRQFDLLIV